MNTRHRPARPSRFYFWMALAIAVTAFVGFSRTYYLKEWFGSPPLPLAVHFHGVVATGFILLFVVQTALIDRRRVRVHRRVGLAGAVLAALLVVSAFAAGIAMARVRAGNPLAIIRLALPFVATPVFAVLVTLGFLYRKRPKVHKRLMLLATINALIPALGRLPYIDAYFPLSFYAAVAAFLLACVFHDWLTDRRVHSVTIWGGALIMASIPARILLGQTEVWRSFATWLLAAGS